MVSPPSPLLSIIIVSYNTKELTLECLRSLYHESPDLDMEVILLDNASADGSATAVANAFPQVKLIASEENHGFGAGNNLAVKQSSGEWVVLLNPDTVVLRKGISRLMEFAVAEKRDAVIGGRSYFADGRLNPTTCWGAPSVWSIFSAAFGIAATFRHSTLFDPESLGSWKRDTVRDVPIVAGCLMAMRREVWDRIEGFDTGFFMYGEDADLCMRARDLGFACIICPDAEFIHYAGASEKIAVDKTVKLFTAKSQLMKKHWSAPAAWIGMRLLAAHCFVRASLSKLVPARRAKAEQWKLSWQRRGEWYSASVPQKGLGGTVDEAPTSTPQTNTA